jgi:hypothetical protein
MRRTLPTSTAQACLAALLRREAASIDIVSKKKELRTRSANGAMNSARRDGSTIGEKHFRAQEMC